MMHLIDRIPMWVPVAVIGFLIGWTMAEIWNQTALLEDIYISIEEQRRIAIAATEREMERLAAARAAARPSPVNPVNPVKNEAITDA